MTTYNERWMQAHHHAVRRGDLAYNREWNLEAASMAYYRTYTREMAAFEALEALRRNAPDQAAVDEMAAALLKAAPAYQVPDECPECGTPNRTGHCAHCDYQMDA